MRRTDLRDPNQEFIGKIVGRRKMGPATLEDADQWMTEMMARTHAHELSKTSPASAAPSKKPEPAKS